jgi:hypothetical protein
MKTTTNNNRASKMAAAFCTALVFITGIWAQPNPDNYKNSLYESFSRMEAIIARTEEAVKYVAPAVKDWNEITWAEQNAIQEELVNCVRRLDMLAAKIEKALKYKAEQVVPDDTESAWERLEMLANNTENEIMYRVPVEEQANAPEYAAHDNNQEKDADSDSNAEEFLSFNPVTEEYE